MSTLSTPSTMGTSPTATGAMPDGIDPTSSPIEALHEALRGLGLSEADAVVEAHLERASKQDSTYAQFLTDLLHSEAQARRARQLAMRLRTARLPFAKTLEQFDFAFQPSVEERQVQELATLRFAHEAGNVILLGPPGVGKTHLCGAGGAGDRGGVLGVLRDGARPAE